MSPPFEKKYTWIDRDSRGRLCLFRKVRRSHKYEKEVEIFEVCNVSEDSDEETTVFEIPPHPGCPQVRYDFNHTGTEFNILPIRNKGNRTNVYETVRLPENSGDCAPDWYRHHYPTGPPSPPPLPKPALRRRAPPQVSVPVVELPPVVEIRRPRNCSPSPIRTIPRSSSFKLREFFCHSPPPSPTPKSRRLSIRQPKIYQVVDPKLKLEKVPVRKLYQHPPRLEKVKVERIRPERVGDFDDRSKNHGRTTERGRQHACRPVEYEEVEVSRVRAPHRTSYSRTMVSEDREHEGAVWNDDLDAFVVKRTPTVRFE